MINEAVFGPSTTITCLKSFHTLPITSKGRHPRWALQKVHMEEQAFRIHKRNFTCMSCMKFTLNIVYGLLNASSVHYHFPLMGPTMIISFCFLCFKPLEL